MKSIILASGSPRRHELLTLLGISHEVIPCKEEEEKVTNSQPASKHPAASSLEQNLLEVAYQKVQCVIKDLATAKKQDAIVIGADTIVILDDAIIGKPKSKEDAVSMLQTILGRVHEVYTGLCLVDLETNTVLTAVEKTNVSMIEWPLEKIKAYVEAENVLDKAGAYAIQGIGAAMIDRIEGCFYNVMGLPLNRLVKMLNRLDFEYLTHSK